VCLHTYMTHSVVSASILYQSMALHPFVAPWTLFQFLDLFTRSVGFLGRGISPSQGRYLHTGQHKHRTKRTQTSIPQVGFEPTIPVFEQAKTVRVLDRAATVVDFYFCYCFKTAIRCSIIKWLLRLVFFCFEGTLQCPILKNVSW
jgi:hypothetical protein